jgi:glycosyltransferase involved in cell wall biosynthesis
VDQFVCPSHFLRDRYIDWGLPAQKMLVLENGQPPRAAGQKAPAALAPRFVLLGQLSRLKGTLVLVEAVKLLPKRLREALSIEIHGSIQYEVDEFKATLARALAGLEDTVRYCGPYRPEDVGGIIQSAGWVIVPSIWWENSPLVIQEAFAAGRPVICSNIGGMAEKVVNGVSGLHFRVGSAADLAAKIAQAAEHPALWESLSAGVPKPPSIQDTVDRLVTLYGAARLKDAAPELPGGNVVSIDAAR